MVSKNGALTSSLRFILIPAMIHGPRHITILNCINGCCLTRSNSCQLELFLEFGWLIAEAVFGFPAVAVEPCVARRRSVSRVSFPVFHSRESVHDWNL